MDRYKCHECLRTFLTSTGLEAHRCTDPDASQASEAPRPPLQGCKLLAMVPVLRPGEQSPHEWLVVVERELDARDVYVSARVDSPDSPTWSNGFYARTFMAALNDAVQRAGWGVYVPTPR